MKYLLNTKSITTNALFIAFLGLSFGLQGQVKKVYSDSVNKEDLTQVMNHLIKNSFRNKRIERIVLSKNVTIYSFHKGLNDTVNIDLSTLNLEDKRIEFSNNPSDTLNSLIIQKIKYFSHTNKYELNTSYYAGSASGYSASYFYKKRRGIFKRWVYKRFIRSTH